MKIEDRLKGYRILEEPTAREEKIMETVRASQNAFFEREQEQQLSRWEFLWIQMKFIRKKWWALQALLLAGFWCVLQFNAGAEDSEVQRQILGIAATLFTILIIPEFWKNRSSRSMEIEEASFFSLRQVYAARMVLFAMADVLFISLFLGAASMSAEISFLEGLVQFLLPVSITACICFRILCSKRAFGEGAAMVFCLLWNGVWSAIILNQTVYQAIRVPVWMGLLGVSVFYLFLCARRLLSLENNNWEEDPIWN